MGKIFLLICLIFSFPSKAYWQQHTHTQIKVNLDDKQHLLRGMVQITYTNNSPDTLRQLYFHLYPNAYKNDRTAFCEQQLANGKKDFYFSAEEDKGLIDSLSFSINGQVQEFVLDDAYIDIARLTLDQNLLPGQSIIISTPFKVKIPKAFSRLGHKGQVYYISQWYPKPAVYDAHGWHPMPYLDQGEFYSEIGSYDVQITLPQNYIVMATGDCQTATEHRWMDSLARLPNPSDTLYRRSSPASSTVFKTINFTADSVHDFAWFADKRWVLKMDSVVLENRASPTKIYAAFLPYHQQKWAAATQIAQHSLQYLSRNLGSYPYATLKVAEGEIPAGGGMEYPTLAIVDAAAINALQEVLVHEIGHNWFYGMIASNERIHPWLDEGLNSFYEQKTIDYIKIQTSDYSKSGNSDFVYHQLAATRKDQAIALPAADFRALNYGADVYIKSAIMLRWLEQYMGEDTFAVAMKSYFETWKYKHPSPADFRKSMQDQSLKSLDWFFEAALKSDRPIDFKIKKATKTDSGLRVHVLQYSDIAAPVQLSVYNADTLVESAWVLPFVQNSAHTFAGLKAWDKVVVRNDWAEHNISNNQYYNRAVFPKGFLKIGLGFGTQRSQHQKIFLLPFASYNTYDSFSVGLLIHNLSIPQRRFQFALAPQIGVFTKRINGLASVSYNWYPRSVFSEIKIQANVKTFSLATSSLNIANPLYARYFKVAPSILFTFKEADARSPILRQLTLSQYNIYEQQFAYKRDLSVDSLYRPSLEARQQTYASLSYAFRNARTLNPYSYNATFLIGKTFAKLSFSGNLQVHYERRDKSFYVRGFAAKLFQFNTALDNSRYYLNATSSGRNYYLYDNLFLGRNANTGFFAKQISIQEGGQKTPTNQFINPLGRSDNWLLAINLKTDLPFGKLPLRFFADIATFADAKQLNPSASPLLLSAGLELHLFREVLSVYLPLWMSSDYTDYLKSIFPKNKMVNSISFSVNMQHFNLLKANETLFKQLTF
ncbi:MAG: M1 family metallopeptidase [Chitinophagaceae bacterium]|nr:M1 family metallopeptidase [Chitinophagaceae bacterium]